MVLFFHFFFIQYRVFYCILPGDLKLLPIYVYPTVIIKHIKAELRTNIIITFPNFFLNCNRSRKNEVTGYLGMRLIN